MISQLKETIEYQSEVVNQKLLDTISGILTEYGARYVMFNGCGLLGVEPYLEWNDEVIPYIHHFKQYTPTDLSAAREYSWTDPRLVEIRENDEELMELVNSSTIQRALQSVHGLDFVAMFGFTDNGTFFYDVLDKPL